MSPLRARKALRLGPWLRVNFTLRSVSDWLRDWLPDGHVDPGRRPWSSITLGPRGLSYNTKRRRARVDLPGPFSYETPLWEMPGPFTYGEPRDGRPPVWTDGSGNRFEQTTNATGGTTTRYLPDPVTEEEALRETCPRCGAEPDFPCHTARGRVAGQPHMLREELARARRRYPETPDRQFSCEHGTPADTRCELCDVPGPHEHDASCPDFCPDIPPWGTPPR
jgi:hypothetical protein